MSMKKIAVPDTYLAQYDGMADGWISTSVLSTLMMCGMAVYYKYILRVPEPISIRPTAGTGAHKGREVNLKQKVETKEDISLDEVTDAARDSVEESFENAEYQPTSEFEGKSKKQAEGMTKDMAVEFTTADYEAFQVKAQPLAVEKSIAVDYGLSRIIVGKLDEINLDYSIDDLKTSKAAFGQAKADSSMAFSTYGMLTLAEYGVLPPAYNVHNISRGKTGCKPHLYSTTRTKEDIQRQLIRFAAGIKAIEAGNFIPCDPSHWKCSEDYCGYYKMCPYGGGDIKKREK